MFCGVPGRWRIGAQILVFLHDQEMVREAFTGTDFIDRPHWRIFNLNEKNPKGEPVTGIMFLGTSLRGELGHLKAFSHKQVCDDIII